MADAIFGEPRLAEIYDPLDPDRSDLDVYAAMADEFGARSVLGTHEELAWGGTYAELVMRQASPC